MSKISLITLLILMSGRSFAQQDHFVLIQADYNQPFYARMGDRTFNSSSKGHLIISQLKDSTYNIIIGFPKNLFPEQQFSFIINQKDLDLQLKDLGEKGWGLFNSQSQELKMADSKTERSDNHPEGVKKDDAFSRMMAGVVGDTAVMYNTYAMEEVLKDSPVKAVSTVTSSVAETSGVALVSDKASSVVGTLVSSNQDTSIGKEPIRNGADSVLGTSAGKADSSKAVASVPLHRTGIVRKISERRTAKAMRLVYADHIKGRKADTIVVIIPIDSGAQMVQHRADTLGKSGSTNMNVVASTGTGPQQPEPQVNKGGTGGAGDANPAPLSSTGTLPVDVPVQPKVDSGQKKGRPKPILINSDCKNFASDYDVDKLRVKMLEAGKDDDQLAVARKIFRTKCFTTKQVRALSEVFTSDASRFRFFETAYPFVSDDRFKELADLLTDPVYNSKFKAMVGPK